MDENVLRLNVSMNNVLFAHLLECFKQLHEVEPYVNFSDTPALLFASYQAVEVALVAVFEYDVDAAVGLVRHKVI